jgi:hypothetical protein
MNCANFNTVFDNHNLFAVRSPLQQLLEVRFGFSEADQCFHAVSLYQIATEYFSSLKVVENWLPRLTTA